MDTATKIKLLSVTALVTALLGTYFTALHIDSLARERYIFKRWLLFIPLAFHFLITSILFVKNRK